MKPEDEFENLPELKRPEIQGRLNPIGLNPSLVDPMI
jgi:hypothetical protein